MKSIAVQYVEAGDLLKADGVTDAELKEAEKDCVNEEHRLSVRLSMKKKRGIKESGLVEIRESGKKITRNAGSGTFTENDTKSRDERVLHFMEDGRFTYRESCFMLGETPERGVKQPASITEAIMVKWKKFSPWISEKDARTLAETGKLP